RRQPSRGRPYRQRLVGLRCRSMRGAPFGIWLVCLCLWLAACGGGDVARPAVTPAPVRSAASPPARSPACEAAERTRARAHEAIGRGLFDRAIRIVAVANQACAEEQAASWPDEIVALVELGRVEDA